MADKHHSAAGGSEEPAGLDDSTDRTTAAGAENSAPPAGTAGSAAGPAATGPTATDRPGTAPAATDRPGTVPAATDPTTDAPTTATAAGSAVTPPTVKPLNRHGFLARSGAEAFGAFVLILGGVSVSMFGGQTGIPSGLAFGLVLIAGIIAVGHISGGHFNPAVTLGHAIAGRMAWKDVVPYIVAQVLGGVLAMGLLWVVLSGSSQISEQSGALFSAVSNGFGEHSPSMFPLTSVLLLEVILTALFLGIILGATSARANKVLAPVAIGLTYAVIIQVALPISGAGLNPARSTATVFFADGWAIGQLWLFWVAPLAGAVIAGLIYRSFEPAPAEPAGVDSAGPDTGMETAAASTDRVPAASVRGTAEGEPATSADAAPAADDAADARRFFDGDKKH